MFSNCVCRFALIAMLSLKATACGFKGAPSTLSSEQDVINAQIAETNRKIAEQERIKQLNAARNQENRRIIDDLSSRGINVRESSRGIVINLPDVLFAYGSADLTTEARKIVGSIAGVLKTIPGRKIVVEGHTDNAGSIDFNYTLSDKRARAVANQLQQHGVAQEVVSTRAFGESEPLATNRTPEGRSQNRRVEVIIENPAV